MHGGWGALPSLGGSCLREGAWGPRVQVRAALLVPLAEPGRKRGAFRWGEDPPHWSAQPPGSLLAAVPTERS